jgi:putative MATE family efflux protein
MPAPRRQFDSRLLEGSIVRSLFTLAVPIVGANILQVAYQLVDAFWVGRLGAAAVAAVSITMPLMFVLVAAGMGFAIAGTTLIAQYTGARDHAMVDHVAAQTLIAITAVAVVLASIGIGLLPWILHAMGVAPAVYSNALSFMRIIFAALPFTFGYAMVQALLRGVGEVTIPLYIVAGTVIMNFILDPVLIFGHAGFPVLGVAGAAIATLVAQIVAAGVGMVILFGGRFGIHLDWHHFRPDFAFIKRAFLLGYPASIEQSTRGLGMLVMTFLVTSFGTVAIASYGVGTNVVNVVVIPAMGLAMATTTLVGQNIGAGNIKRAESVARLAALVTFVALTVAGGLCFFLAEPIMTFFVPKAPGVIAEGARFIRIMSWSFGFVGLQFALLAVLRASGEMLPAMATTLFSQWCLQLPVAWLLSRHLSVDGLWWSLPVANVAAALIAAALFQSGRWKTRRLAAPSSIAAGQLAVEEEAQM